ncbi:MAG: hypothetical protein RLP09_32800 [Sandaracinaceae bacterium]
MRTTWIGLLTASLALAGCGGESTTLEDAGQTGMDSGPGPGADGGGGDPDGGPGADDGGPITADDGGIDPDDGGPTALDGGPGGGGDAGPSGIACGAEVCDPATQQCCRTRGGGGIMEACIASDAMCDGVPATCDGPEDCASGEVCCLSAGAGGGSAMCTASDACDGRRACNVMADCPAGQMCCDASGFGFMGGVCNMRCFAP